jgi:adenylate cyclase
MASEIFIPEKKGYLGNIPLLQHAAKEAGFINSTPDSDGIIRFSPLIYRLGTNIYGSLALVAVREYLQPKEVTLKAKPYKDDEFLEAIQLDQISIPVDPFGRILVPYRGHAYSFSPLSATDVLHQRIPKETIQGKLVFIGATATGSGDRV